MKILFVDTETSGLPNFREPSDHSSQPHMLQLAAIKLEWDDVDGPMMARDTGLNRYIRSDDFTVDERMIGDDGKPTAFASHGITQAKLNADGRPLKEVMEEFDAEFMADVDEIYAYGAAFDRRILRIAALRTWGREGHPRAGAPKPTWRCVLLTASALCKMPATPAMIDAGRGSQFKPPKLSEAHRWAFGEDFAGAHDAMNDLRATLRLWRHIRDNHGGNFVTLKEKD